MAVIGRTTSYPTPLSDAPLAEIRHQMRELRRFERSTRFVARHRSKLTDQYPDKWVAVRDAKVAIVASSFEVLVRKIRRVGLRPGDFHVEYLNTKPEIWIL